MAKKDELDLDLGDDLGLDLDDDSNDLDLGGDDLDLGGDFDLGGDDLGSDLSLDSDDDLGGGGLSLDNDDDFGGDMSLDSDDDLGGDMSLDSSDDDSLDLSGLEDELGLDEDDKVEAPEVAEIADIGEDDLDSELASFGKDLSANMPAVAKGKSVELSDDMAVEDLSMDEISMDGDLGSEDDADLALDDDLSLDEDLSLEDSSDLDDELDLSSSSLDSDEDNFDLGDTDSSSEPDFDEPVDLEEMEIPEIEDSETMANQMGALPKDDLFQEEEEETSFGAFDDKFEELGDIEPMEADDYQIEPLEDVTPASTKDMDLGEELFEDEEYNEGSFEVDLGDQPTLEKSQPSQTSGEPLLANKLLYKLPHKLKVEVGGATLTGEEITSLRYGSIIEMDKKIGDPVDIFLSGECIAQGEVVQINEDQLGVRITRINF